MNPFLTSILLVIGTVIFVLRVDRFEEKWIKSILDWFPSILFAYLIPALFTHLFEWDLSGVVLHSWSKSIIIPLAIVSVMSALSFEQLKIIGWRPLVLFVGGSFAIATLPVILSIAFGSFDSDLRDYLFEQEYWKGLVPIVGGWIGGSTSQLVLKELSGCPENLFLAVLIVDNILVNIWTILMFQLIKKSDELNDFLNIRGVRPCDQAEHKESNKNFQTSLLTLCVTVLTVLIIGYWVDSFLWQVILLSISGLLLGNLIHWWDHSIVLKVGGVLIILIMAILGLKLNFANFSLPIMFVVLIVVWLVLHFVVMLLLAYGLKVHVAWVPIASMANLGGISTAPAVTAAYEVKWMPHAILLAILSMVTGTGWGMLTWWLFSQM